MELDERINKLTEIAVKCGASRYIIRYIPAEKIVVTDQWVRWKCQFGCAVYGDNLCCPPFTPTPQETKQLIQEYNHALLIGFKIKASEHVKHRKKIQV